MNTLEALTNNHGPFTPYNRHVEVEPIEESGIVSSQNVTFEEKGKVLSSAEDCDAKWDVGDIVYFDAWLVAKYKDSKETERWLVPEQNIRAYESVSK